MNPILNSSKKVIKINSLKMMNNKIIKPCNPNCICLLYLDLSDKRSQIYYDNCFRTKIKLNPYQKQPVLPGIEVLKYKENQHTL